MCTILTYQVKLIHSSVERVAMGRCVSHDADDDDEMTSSEIDEKQDENATLTMCSFSSFYTASHICCVAAIYFYASSSSMQVVRHECLIKPTEISSMQLLYVNKLEASKSFLRVFQSNVNDACKNSSEICSPHRFSQL